MKLNEHGWEINHWKIVTRARTHQQTNFPSSGVCVRARVLIEFEMKKKIKQKKGVLPWCALSFVKRWKKIKAAARPNATRNVSPPSVSGLKRKAKNDIFAFSSKKTHRTYAFASTSMCFVSTNGLTAFIPLITFVIVMPPWTWQLNSNHIPIASSSPLSNDWLAKIIAAKRQEVDAKSERKRENKKPKLWTINNLGFFLSNLSLSFGVAACLLM